MPSYDVIVVAPYELLYLVEAESEEDALEQVLAGDIPIAAKVRVDEGEVVEVKEVE